MKIINISLDKGCTILFLLSGFKTDLTGLNGNRKLSTDEIVYCNNYEKIMLWLIAIQPYLLKAIV
jgi:hypothetical protein